MKKGIQMDTILDDMIKGKVPEGATIYLDQRALIQVFTKKRLELIESIEAVRPTSIQQLVIKLKRKKQAVYRDLKLLEGHDIIKLHKQGRKVIPEVIKTAIYFPIKRQKLNGIDKKFVKKEN